MTKTEPPHSSYSERSAILLIAKSAFAASPHLEMKRLAELCLAHGIGNDVRFAFTEQGTPSLYEALERLVESKHDRVIIVPLVLPVEPSFHNWLTKALRRWRATDPRPWPELKIAADLASSPRITGMIADLIKASSTLDLTPAARPSAEGSIVPAQKRRVLVCEGNACNCAGADAIWGHLRNQQERRKLRITGHGTMTAKSTCLGPCNLAPVLQVFPEGTYYGGVTEAVVDRIVEDHLIGGRVVEAFAYHPNGRKQRLRP